jgi:tRNA (guanine-N(7)-)-methyltransferase
MRLKNVKGATKIVESSPYIIQNPIQYCGHFCDVFQNQNPIYIEIGMGKGNFIIENAKKYPNINFIGIEKYDSVMIRAVQKLENTELNNLKLIRIDANEIEKIFSHEIDLIYLNFSDPWPKTRHEKRRLMSPNFLNKYQTIFRNINHIIFKTDNRKLFEYAIMTFEEQGFHINQLCLDLYDENDPLNIPTEYELKFHDQGFPIYKIDVEK